MTTTKKATTKTVQIADVLTNESFSVTVWVSDSFTFDNTVKITKEFTLYTDIYAQMGLFYACECPS
jgi:hypothetical protein